MPSLRPVLSALFVCAVRTIALFFELEYRMWGFRFLGRGRVVEAFMQLISGGYQSIPLALVGVALPDDASARETGGAEFSLGRFMNLMIVMTAGVLPVVAPDELKRLTEIGWSAAGAMMVVLMALRWIHVGGVFPRRYLQLASVVVFLHYKVAYMKQKNQVWSNWGEDAPVVAKGMLLLSLAAFLHGRWEDWRQG